jgi:hypothetical protein
MTPEVVSRRDERGASHDRNAKEEKSRREGSLHRQGNHHGDRSKSGGGPYEEESKTHSREEGSKPTQMWRRESRSQHTEGSRGFLFLKKTRRLTRDKRIESRLEERGFSLEDQRNYLRQRFQRPYESRTLFPEEVLRTASQHRREPRPQPREQSSSSGLLSGDGAKKPVSVCRYCTTGCFFVWFPVQ